MGKATLGKLVRKDLSEEAGLHWDLNDKEPDMKGGVFKWRELKQSELQGVYEFGELEEYQSQLV